MANIEHPRLFVESPFDTLEQSFAEESFEALFSFSINEEVEFVDGYKVTYAVTDRCDVRTEEGYCALRLRAIPQILGESVQDCRVVMLEYSHFTEEWMDENEPIIDSDLTWVPYVVAVSEDTYEDTELTDSNISVLNAATGEELAPGDLIEATSILRQLKSELCANRFKEDAEFFDNGFTVIKNAKYIDFEPELFIEGNECGECKSGFTYCQHENNVGSIN